jgi:uncharacterized membrane-anchored protein
MLNILALMVTGSLVTAFGAVLLPAHPPGLLQVAGAYVIGGLIGTLCAVWRTDRVQMD